MDVIRVKESKVSIMNPSVSEALVTMEAILLNSASKSRIQELLGCTDHVHILPAILPEQEDSQPDFG